MGANKSKMNIEHISVSRNSVWDECKMRYKFQYHEKRPVADPPPIYLTFGKIIHRVIEEHTRSRGLANINEIASDIVSGKMDLESGKKAPPLTYEYKKKLKVHLANYMSLAEKIGFEGEIEYRFNFDLEPPNKKMATGFIDRLIKKDGKAFIIDYKTSKVSPWRKDHRTILNDLQLQCYCWIVMTKMKIPAKNIRSSLYYLEDRKMIGACFSEQTLLSVPKKLLEVYNEIERTNPDKVIGTVGEHCKRCDYRLACPTYKLTEN